MRLSLATSIVLRDAPREDRPRLAVAAGYPVIESWWPWAQDVPEAADVDALLTAIDAAGARLHLMNLTEGAAEHGGRGLACRPGESAAFWSNAEAALDIAARAGVRHLNVLAGNIPDAGREAALETLAERLVALGDLAGAVDVGLVVEPLNRGDHPDYVLDDPDAAADLVRTVRARTSGDVGLLADAYHLAASGLDAAAFMTAHADVIRHVQLADHPGRGRPGTGSIAFDRILAALETAGYTGMVGLEYVPDGTPIPAPETLWRDLTAARKVVP